METVVAGAGGLDDQAVAALVGDQVAAGLDALSFPSGSVADLPGDRLPRLPGDPDLRGWRPVDERDLRLRRGFLGL